MVETIWKWRANHRYEDDRLVCPRRPPFNGCGRVMSVSIPDLLRSNVWPECCEQVMELEPARLKGSGRQPNAWRPSAPIPTAPASDLSVADAHSAPQPEAACEDTDHA